MRLHGMIISLLLIFWLFPVPAWTAEPEDGFVLIVNLHNPVTRLKRKEAELIFLSKKRSWPDGRSIAVVINGDPALEDRFCHAVLKRSASQFLVFRKKMLFRGQGMPPPTLMNDKEIIEFVASHEGGIGYITAAALTPAVKAVPISF